MSEKVRQTEKQNWTIFHSLHTGLIENEKKRKVYNRSLGGTMLSLIGSMLILINVMCLNLGFYSLPINLMALSGILVVAMTVFMYVDSKYHFFWGGIVLFSSSLSYLALGLAAGTWQMIPGALAFVLGTSGGLLGFFDKKE